MVARVEMKFVRDAFGFQLPVKRFRSHFEFEVVVFSAVEIDGELFNGSLVGSAQRKGVVLFPMGDVDGISKG